MYMVPFYSETSYIASGWDEYCLMATFRLALGFLILSAIAIVCCHWLILKSLSKKSVGSKNFFEIYQIICCHRFSILIFSVDDFFNHFESLSWSYCSSFSWWQQLIQDWITKNLWVSLNLSALWRLCLNISSSDSLISLDDKLIFHSIVLLVPLK